MADDPLSSATEALLHRLASQAKDSVGRCDSAGVTLVDGGAVTGRGCTDTVAHELDRAQSDADEGPGVDALRFLQIFNVGTIADAQQWPAFRQVAGRKGILSSMSIPLSAGGRAVGTVSLYSRTPYGFQDCEMQAMDFASRAAALLVEAVLQET